MKTLEEVTKILTNLGAMQHQGHAGGLPCPRCGKQTMSNHMSHNALSRFIDVYICDLCGMEEALTEASGQPVLPLNQWSIITGLDRSAQEEQQEQEAQGDTV